MTWLSWRFRVEPPPEAVANSGFRTRVEGSVRGRYWYGYRYRYGYGVAYLSLNVIVVTVHTCSGSM